MFYEKYKLVIVLILVIVLCAVYAGSYHYSKMEEGFTGQQDTQTSVVQRKSLTYFPYIADFAFTNIAPANTMYINGTGTPNLNLQVFSFLPSYADGLCSWITPQPSSCSNYFINNISFPDTYDYSSFIQCKNIEASIGMDKSQCTSRILNNLYTLRKKCLRFCTDNDQKFSIYMSNITQSGSTYNVTVSTSHANQLDLFCLLRPTLISFGNFGLYKVMPLDVSDTMFHSYSSTRESNTFVIKSVTTATAGNATASNTTTDTYKIYPDVNAGADFIATFAKMQTKNWNVLGNAYFFNYEGPSFSNSTSTETSYNTFNMIFDNQSISDYFSTNNSILPNPSNPITFKNNSISTVCTSLSYAFDYSQFNATDFTFFTVKVSYPGTSSAPIALKVHEDFSKKIAEYIKANGSSMSQFLKLPYITFHIVVVYTLDLMIILSMLKDYNTNMTFTYMKQYPVQNASTPIFMQYLGDKHGKISTQDKFLKNHYTQFTNMCPNTSIPNLAVIAKALGYYV